MEDWLLEEDDQEPTSFPITVHTENSAVEIRDALTLNSNDNNQSCIAGYKMYARVCFVLTYCS